MHAWVPATLRSQKDPEPPPLPLLLEPPPPLPPPDPPPLLLAEKPPPSPSSMGVRAPHAARVKQSSQAALFMRESVTVDGPCVKCSGARGQSQLGGPPGAAFHVAPDCAWQAIWSAEALAGQ
jgi:hypothetical protein